MKKILFPRRHDDNCILKPNGVGDYTRMERETFSESMCTCGVYEKKKEAGLC